MNNERRARRDEELTYRLLTRDDVETLKQWAESDDVRFEHYTFAQCGSADLDGWYRAKQKFLSKKLYGLVADGRVLGFVTLRQMNFITRTASVGIAIDPAYLSRGYGTTLLLRHLDHVYERFPIDTLHLKVAVFNQRAIRAYQKAGFFIDGEAVWEPYESQMFASELLACFPDQFRRRGDLAETRFYNMSHTRGTVRLQAPAKINLALDVKRRLPNGYHELDMVMQAVTLADDVILRPRRDDRWTLWTAPALQSEDNLALKAARCMADTYSLPRGCDISIVKRIPVAAGLAGGSTDAAAVIRGIDRLYGLRLSFDEMARVGARLGADVPFCLLGGTAIARGVGERLTPVRVAAPMHYVIVTPDASVSTREVFEAFESGRVGDGDRPDVDALAEGLRHPAQPVQKCMKNVLESVTMSWHPAIPSIKRDLEELGAVHALMSGSGPSVWGWFRDREAAERAYAAMKRRYNNCFVCEAERVEGL